jgi:hypothetical protein
MKANQTDSNGIPLFSCSNSNWEDRGFTSAYVLHCVFEKLLFIIEITVAILSSVQVYVYYRKL